MFMSTLDEKVRQDFLSEFNQKVERKFKLVDFKEEMWDTVVEFEEPVLMANGLDEKARGELLDKMVQPRREKEEKQSSEAKSCKDSSTAKEKTGK